MKNFNTIVVVGSQWGDEGKGKITDVIAESCDIVARFAGGHNAGHLVKIGDSKHKVTIIPSGIFRSNCISVIGNGCVVNLPYLVEEYEKVKKEFNGKIGKLLISDRAQLVMPWHPLLDELEEEARGSNKIGTTKRGIGPAYRDKVARINLRVGDIPLPNFKERLKNTFDYQNKVIQKIYNHTGIDFDPIYEELKEAYEKIKHMIIDCGEFLEQALKENKKVLFEGAQGALLDIDHGTYPYVTSSNCSANNVAVGVGIHHKWISTTIGLAKAYCTRVAEGAFPTELLNEVGDGIRERGHEYGSNSGRPRRIGWLDLVALKYAIRTSGLDEIFVTLLDVLTGIDELKVCVKYELDGRELNSIPATNEEYTRCKPIYKSFQGWTEDITRVKSKEQLPLNAQKYLDFIAKICDVSIAGFSVGPDREQTIFLNKELLN